MKTVELDPHNGFRQVGVSHPGVVPAPAHRGFEVPGDLNNLSANKPYIEGSWVTKRNGTYYWQYAAPGTQYKSYADGLFTATSPTGPWTYADNSPVSHKPTGFLGGVGHSSTFEDFAGQSWHISTAALDVRDASCGETPVALLYTRVACRSNSVWQAISSAARRCTQCAGMPMGTWQSKRI
jgi:xylan 1,4-beta-xylosidase